jgi:hypothetical protein
MPFTLRPYHRLPVPFLKLPLAHFVSFWSLIILLLLSSGPAYAEWVSLDADTQRGGAVYMDPDTIRLKGDVVTMWSLHDYKTIQTMKRTSFLSSKVQNEFDCAEERQRELAVTWFSSKMGTGNGVWTNSDEIEWRPVAPGSVG